MYFQDYYEKTPYMGQNLTNITRGIIIKNSGVRFQKYQISGTKSALAVSEELYRTPQYYWVLEKINNVVHPTYDWIMPGNILEDYTKMVHGSLDKILYYTNDNKRVTELARHLAEQTTIPGTWLPITAIDLESAKNDRRRDINIIAPNQIKSIVRNIRNA